MCAQRAVGRVANTMRAGRRCGPVAEIGECALWKGGTANLHNNGVVSIAGADAPVIETKADKLWGPPAGALPDVHVRPESMPGIVPG